ncbi:MAG: hypothetical protein J6Y01_04740, partial [Spirochaetales bacterium]|nr:hypothetical protein [Spirochaetales bacterium]
AGDNSSSASSSDSVGDNSSSASSSDSVGDNSSSASSSDSVGDNSSSNSDSNGDSSSSSSDSGQSGDTHNQPNSNKITSLQTIIDAAADNSTLDLSQYSSIEANLSATINKKITINAGGLDLNEASLTIAADGVELYGIGNASVTASSSLGNGSLKISSSSLSSLIINGGGINSIYILDVSVDTITIEKQSDSYRDDIVRLVYDESTDFGTVVANSDLLLYYDGKNSSTPLDASKITIGSNVNVAANTAITSSENTVVAAITLSDSTAPSLNILLNSGNKINETLVNQTVAYLSPNNEKLISTDKVIDFTETITENQDYTIANRNEYEFIFDFDGTAENTYILKNKTTGQPTIPSNIANGLLSPRYTTQVSDKDGNIYMTYTSEGLKSVLIIGITYSELCKIEETGNCTMATYSIVKVNQDELLPILDKQHIRLAIYEKGETKHLFILQNQLWDMTNDYNAETNQVTYYNPNVICLDVTTDKSNSSLGFKAIGMAELNINNGYTFGQAIAVDENENLYIGINSFETKQNDAGQAYFDFGTAVVNKYYFAPLKEGGTNQFNYTEFDLELQESHPYSDYLDSTIYNVTNPIENPTLYRILLNYTFG